VSSIHLDMVHSCMAATVRRCLYKPIRLSEAADRHSYGLWIEIHDHTRCMLTILTTMTSVHPLLDERSLWHTHTQTNHIYRHSLPNSSVKLRVLVLFAQ